jgi:hypothetical protein
MIGNKMIEYRLLNRDNSPVTLYNIGGISAAIGCMFPETDRQKVGDKNRTTHEVNGDGYLFNIYCGEKSTDIGLPLKYQKEIKKMLKNIAQVKFWRN